jgi:HlyD family secretion protein
MLSMADLRDMQVEVDVNQSDLKKLRLNMPVTVVPDAHPERVYQGSLVEMAPEANRQKATLQVKIQIAKPDTFIRPEMNARVVFEEPARNPGGPPQVLVPRQAVVARGNARLVYVIVDGKAVERPVTLGPQSGVQVEVLNGLEGVETVAVSGVGGLKDGHPVRTKP